MKKTAKMIGIVAAILVVAIVALNLTTDKRLRTEVDINASSEQVWQVLMNFEGHSNWNPFIKEIKGDPQVGNNIEVMIQSPGKKPMAFVPEVLVNKENEEFRWVGKLGMKGIVDGEHYFVLIPMADGKTKLIHGEQFSGILSGLFVRLIGKDTHAGFELMNKAMQAKAEGA